MFFSEILKAILYGVTEGITEWLPISSTGHLILLDALLGFSFPDPVFAAEFRELFDVLIQLGAILAVAVLYGRRLWPIRSVPIRSWRFDRPTLSLWCRILPACLPAAVAGLLADALCLRFTGRDLDAWLYNPPTVACMLILYGVAFLAVERRRDSRPRVTDVGAIGVRDALLIGCFQALSIVSGTSRSGATILGALLLGVARPAAAEFSFFLALPVMAGAGLVKAVGFGRYLRATGAVCPPAAWLLLLIGGATAFLVSLVAICYLVGFVRRHSFGPFGVYRILLGTLVLLIFLTGRI